MTGKEIFMQAIKFNKTPRVPVGVLDGYAWILNQTGKSFQDLFDGQDTASIVSKHYRLLQTDIVYMNGHVFNEVHNVMGGVVNYSHIGEAVEITKPPLDEIGDYKKFDANKVMSDAFKSYVYQSVFKQAKALADEFSSEYVVSSLSYAPFTVAGMLVGVQDFMAGMRDDDDETIGLIDFATDLVIKSADKFIECGAETVFLADPVASGDLISPSLYDEFVLPSIKKICAYFSKRNIPVFCHICGQTEKRLQPLLSSGISAFSMDAVPLKTALDVAYGHYAIMGNLSPFDVILSKTPDEIKAIAKQRIEEAGNKGGYILFPGCDIPPKAPLENIQAMVAGAYGRE